MSDSNDRAKRQAVLERLIQELHDGRAVDEVKSIFSEQLGDVSAEEIAELEQNLIAEGMPETEVKRLCDVHVEVFRESLDAQSSTRPETMAGHPVHTFLAENEAAKGVLEKVEMTLDALLPDPADSGLANARQALAALQSLEVHYLRKENILFPYLEKYNFSGPSSVMWAIHDDIRAGWKALGALLEDGPGDDGPAFSARIVELFAPLQTAIREMIYKEEHILFPTALQKLSHEEWVEIRQQEATVGYAYVEPGEAWLPTYAVQTEVGDLVVPAFSAPRKELNLDTGRLSHEQVNLILTHLPVEVTFVDENDRVRFYSEVKDPIFPRSPAAIGRRVQNCHPPASVHKVQQILDDFRAGQRDAAEFWIHMQGMYVYIRYFAVRDEDGTYRGTLEVTQEITRIQELEGERRLLHD